ncbi:MAG: transglutaminase domain-containing protein [Thermoplasmatota archaeon]
MRSFTVLVLMLLLFIPIQMNSSGFDEKDDDPNDSGVAVEKVLLGSYQREVLIGPGDDHVVEVDPLDMTFDPDGEEAIDPKAESALHLVPSWLRTDLKHKFGLLSSGDQRIFAELITDVPEERFRDEIAFCIAHSTPQTLTDDDFFPDLITHNAELIYEQDAYLDHVRIVEKEDHTTVAYRQTDGSEVEIDKELYYWFVVHPKLGDELPTYVDPEYDYTNDPPFNKNHGTAPPTGKFWRDWLFVHSKEGQPLLRDSLEGKNTTIDAIKAINDWISGSMEFTSDQERPVQPVRIYQKGFGRCGEYQDMRSAAARTALIPVVATSNPAEDHVWNEFWDLEWYHWDGIIDDPGMYERGWGKTLSSVWNSRGDGYTWPVTSRYSDVCTLDISVVDKAGRPVDGADVEILTENFYQPEVKTTSISGTTDHNGSLVLEVGEGRNYWGRASTTDLGSDPAEVMQPKEIVMGSAEGENYEVVFRLPRQPHDPMAIIGSSPGSDVGTLVVDIQFQVEENILRGSSPVAPGRFDRRNSSGNIDLYFTDGTGITAYRSGGPFNTFEMQERVARGSVSLNISTDRSWGLILSNLFSQHTSKIVSFNISVSELYGIRIDSPAQGEEIFMGDHYQVEGIYLCPEEDHELEIRIGDDGPWEDLMCNIQTHEGNQTVRVVEYYWHVEVDRPGPMRVWIRLTSMDGGVITVFREVRIVDGDRPRISVDQGEPKAREGDDIELSGRVSDNVGVVSVWYTLEGYDDRNDIELMDDGMSWRTEVPTTSLGIGLHTLTIHAEDPSGNVGTADIEIKVCDRDPPDIRIDEPEEGSIFMKGEIVTVKGRIYERTVVEQLFVSIGDSRTMEVTDALLPDGTFSYDLSTNIGSLQGGRNVIKVRAVDDGSNLGEAERIVILDTEAPEIELGELSDGMVCRSIPDPRISFSIRDDIGPVEVEMVPNDGDALDVTRYLQGDTFSMKLDVDEYLHEGWNSILIRAVDRAGWITEESFDCYIDGSPPEMEMTDVPEYVVIGGPRGPC